jgi:hypothetical protein
MLSAENMRRPSHCQCSSGSSCTAPSRRAIASSLAKMPTSRVRPLMVRFAERGEKQKLDDDDSTSRQAHGKGPRPTRGPAPRDLDARGPMDRKIRSIAGQAVYPLRKTIVEPVFGQINGTRGLSWGVVRLVELALEPGKRTCPTAIPARCNARGGYSPGMAPQPARQRQHKAEAAAKGRSGGRCRGEAAQAPPCRANAAED